MIYRDSCEALTTTVDMNDMKSNDTLIYITELQAKCNRMGWHTGTQQIIKFVNFSGISSTIMARSASTSSKQSVRTSASPLELNSPNKLDKTTQ